MMAGAPKKTAGRRRGENESGKLSRKNGGGDLTSPELERPFVWFRRQAVRMKGDFLLATGLGEPYHPFEKGHRNLPNAFAHVTDPESARDFVEECGLLGYDVLWHREHQGTEVDTPPGDYVPWVLGQANTIRFALGLMDALATNNPATAQEVLDAHQVVVSDSDFPAEMTRVGAIPFPIHPIYKGAHLAHSMYFPTQAETGDSLLLARRAVAGMVSGNTVGVAQRMTVFGGHLVSVNSADALIEVVWQHVANWALEVEAGGELRRCEKCQRLFLVTDKRQKYCPPFDSAEKRKRGLSTCGYAARKKRQARKGGDSHSEQEATR